MYIETSTTELSIAAGSSDTAELRFTRPFGAVRVTVTSNSPAGANGMGPDLSDLDRVLVELPSRGGTARRLNLSGNEVNMLPLVAALGATTSDEAAMASSYELFTDSVNTGVSQTTDYAYFDLPVGAAAGEEIRITFEVASAPGPGGATTGFTFRFTALENVPNRNLVFDVTTLGTGTRVDHTFRNDVTPFAMIVGSGSGYLFGIVDNSVYRNLTEVNFDGLPRFTYDDMYALATEADKVITSSVVANSRDAQTHDCAFLQVPAGVKKANIEANGVFDRWVVVAYVDGGVSA